HRWPDQTSGMCRAGLTQPTKACLKEHTNVIARVGPRHASVEMGALDPDIRADADIRSLFPGKAASAPPGGYPPASAGIRADILGYPPSQWPARHILAVVVIPVFLR
ncbi:ATP-dependent DNA helicase sgs1, partial [Puccinia graminis f. sp. tritici]